jgi:PIN domain-containing protein
VATGRRALRFYVDESALGLGKTLAVARDDVVHPGHGWLPSVPTGALDTDWMPVVAGLDLVVIARDRHIRTKPAELRLFRDHRLRAFWVAGKKDLSTWGNLVRVVRWWDRIEEVIRNRGPGPWFYALNENSVTEIRV